MPLRMVLIVAGRIPAADVIVAVPLVGAVRTVADAVAQFVRLDAQAVVAAILARLALIVCIGWWRFVVVAMARRMCGGLCGHSHTTDTHRDTDTDGDNEAMGILI